MEWREENKDGQFCITSCGTTEELEAFVGWEECVSTYPLRFFLNEGVGTRTFAYPVTLLDIISEVGGI